MRKSTYIAPILGLGVLCLALVLNASPAEATSGACSWHGGVSCGSGADWDGSVICSDGWRDSWVGYYNADECKNNSICNPYTHWDRDLYNQDLNTLNLMLTIAEDGKTECVSNAERYYDDCVNRARQSYQKDIDSSCGTDGRVLQIGNEWCNLYTSYYNQAVTTCASDKQSIANECIIYDSTISRIHYCIENTRYIPLQLPELQAPRIVSPINSEPALETVDSPIPVPLMDKNNPLNLYSGWLIKNREFVEVFSVDKNMCLHWIVNEKAADKHFGKTWNNYGNIKEFDEIPTGYRYCDNVSE